MFKNLREKIATSDTSSKNAPGDQNLSRFSSITSLVSDVGSAFSKAITNPQHVQPSSRNSKSFNEFDSMSEYDDSVVQGEVMNKEELFQRYQRAQALAKRYKTRSLEVVECYKQLELENMKLTQTLTDSQDSRIRRVDELKEQIELDKKAKTDIEENYQLMIDEKVELINVLRLQISLLKEGKDLPFELESQIKEKHDLEIQRQKKRDDEIKELKASLSQRENLLLRCKEKMTSLNTELSDMKMKYDSICNTSISGDSCGEQFSMDLAKLSVQHAESLETIRKEHSYRIEKMLNEFEEKKLLLETEIHSEHEEKSLTLKQDLKSLQDKMNRISQENERLVEQVNIKTNIIENLMLNQDISHKENGRSILTADSFSQSFDYETNASNEQVNSDELKSEIKFLSGRIEQLELLKTQTEEETSKIENDLKQLELTLKQTKNEYENKVISATLKIDELTSEKSDITLKFDTLSLENCNLNTALSETNIRLEDLIQNERELEMRYQSLQMELKQSKEEKLNLSTLLEEIIPDNEELKCQMQNIQQDYESERIKSQEQTVLYKQLQDKCDELSTIIEKEILEKDKLLSLLSSSVKNVDNSSTDYDGLMLKIVEMGNDYDQKITDGKEQVQNMDLTLLEKNTVIKELEDKFEDLRQRNEIVHVQLQELENSRDDILKKYNDLNEEIIVHKMRTESLEKEKGEIALIKENEVAELTVEINKLHKTLTFSKNENSRLCLDLEETKSKNCESAMEIDKLEVDISTKDKEVQIITEEVERLRSNISDLELSNSSLTNENQELQRKTEAFGQEIDNLKENNFLLENQKTTYLMQLQDIQAIKEKVIQNFNKLNEEIMEHKRKTDCIEREKELLLKNKNEDKESAESRLHNLTLEFNKLQNTLSCVTNKLTKELEYLQSKNLELDSERLVKEKQIELLANEVQVLKKSLSEVEMLKNDSVKENQELRNVIEDVNNELDLFKEKYAKLEEDMINYSKLNSDFSTCQQEIASLQKKLDENDSKNECLQSLIRDICNLSDVDGGTLAEEEFENRLLLIRAEMNKRNDQLLEMEQLLLSVNSMSESECDDKLVISRLRKHIDTIIRDYKSKTQDKEALLKRLEAEKDVLLKRNEKMVNERFNHFKALVKMFNLVNINEEEQNFAKMVMKALREIVKKSVSLTTELNESLSKLKDMDFELNKSMVECESKDVQLAELKETIEVNGTRLVAVRQELDQSLLRLNELTDEKGRIDEEKQSLRKELNELNEKINALKLDCERQVNDKRNLEKHFDESLEKVKMNHLALEANYKKEIEKQFGYQQETSRQMSENVLVTNTKLEDVLKQSEELLVLNYKYKELVDKAKDETGRVLEKLDESKMLVESLEKEIVVLRNENKRLTRHIEELTETYQEVYNEREAHKTELRSVIAEKQRSVEMLVNLQSTSKDVENQKLNFLDQIKDLESKKRSNEEELDLVRQSIDKVQIEYDSLKKQNCKLVQSLVDEQTNYSRLKSELESKQTEIESYKNKVEKKKKKMQTLKVDHEQEIFEIKQQFDDNKTTTEDDHNHRIKSLAKNFNDKLLAKEIEFQKTFQEALENVRKEEARQKSDLKDEVDTLNKMVIDLETEKNLLFTNLADCEDDIKKANMSLQIKESDMQDLFNEISGYKLTVIDLEDQLLCCKSKIQEDMEQKSKTRELTNTHSYYEDPFVDTVNANDHDILQMHCVDLEEQVRQLHQENIDLKQILATIPQISTVTPPTTREHTISSTRAQTLSNQPSLDNSSTKGISFRSPNTSCSEYTFCPYPITDATEYEYLRDILVKYMTGLETNTLARVVCTVMKFSSDETDRIVRFEKDKKKSLQIQLFS